MSGFVASAATRHLPNRGPEPVVNLLVICPHYALPRRRPHGRGHILVEALAARGHRLHIVTALPWYRHHRIDEVGAGPPARPDGRHGLGAITRLHPFPTDKSNIRPGPSWLHRCGDGRSPAGSEARCRPRDVAAADPRDRRLAARRWRVPMVFNDPGRAPDVAIEVGHQEPHRHHGGAVGSSGSCTALTP